MTSEQSYRTPLYEAHLALGGRMVPFASWEMPVQYSSIKSEHRAVRTEAGLFDVSHMGEFVFRGEQSVDLLQHLTTNDVNSLAVGFCHYSFILNASGGIVDDTMVYRRTLDDFLVVVNAANIQKDWDHIQTVARQFPCADIVDESQDWALLALQGPAAFDVISPHVDVAPSHMPFHTIQQARFDQIDVWIAASGYTGENGLEIFAPSDSVQGIWNALLDDNSVSPCGLGARDTLRLEASLALYGHELDDDTTPLEARLGFAVAASGSYVGAEAITQQRAEGPQKSLIMIEMVDRAIPRQGYPIQSSSGESIGVVTSGSLAPWLNKNIGMGYVDPSHTSIGTELWIQVRDRAMAASVVQRPFYSRPKR
ncbi:glycine cleavage system aminomethyltransferase GcvT [bacterium]|nr:glycine cleavage system protein T [Gemmatimonadota bacterium]MCH2664098.1 glycine cleavage system aminomethyltransferase GcvT [bacterium]